MEKQLLVALTKYRLKEERIGNLTSSKLKSRVGDLANKPEFSECSKEDLLKLFKEVIVETLEEVIEEVKTAEFTS